MREAFPALIAIVILLAVTPSYADLVMEQALQDNAPYRNAVYLYLRLAGVIWIAVELFAALVLWKAYRLLAQAEKRMKMKS